ncbi:MAG: DUF969 domain-containing protein [Rhodospirillaceae bacterium]|nr:DUF969 domain-containing protein [Rhodospirillaceae bacterium]
MLTLLGIAVLVVGFIARINPFLVIAAAALTTGLAGGLDVVAIISLFGKAFNENRYVSVVWLVVAAIGLLEREGLQERARLLMANITYATTGRLLLLYLLLRQIASALGLTSLGGHPQMVRPLIAPMAESAAEVRHGQLPDHTRYMIRAYAAATDNVGLFFGEDIFIAIASILLIKGVLEQNGIFVEPLQLSLWAIPTAIAAALVHGFRLVRFDAKIANSVKQP